MSVPVHSTCESKSRSHLQRHGNPGPRIQLRDLHSTVQDWHAPELEPWGGRLERVGAPHRLVAARAGLEVRGAVMASDAFFPFRDGIDTAAERGIAAVIQPGGSRRDEEVIAAANDAGMAMVFTGMRHFRH